MDPDPNGLQIAAQLLVLLLLTLVNAFFAGAEMAVVSVNKSKIHSLAQKGNKKAQCVEQLFSDSTKFLSTIQVAITFAGFFSSASAATGISQILGQWLAGFSIPYSGTIAVVGVTLILSYFTLVFGELVPKRVALKRADQFSMMTVRPILFISKILSPFIKLLSVSTNGFLRLLGMKPDEEEEPVTEEEIRAQLLSAQFDNDSKKMINSVFAFDDKTARDVMVPRRKVVAIDITREQNDMIARMIDSGFSRIPVYEEDIDKIIGVIYVKDIAKQIVKGEAVSLSALIRPPYFVPDSKPANILLKEMQNAHVHIAVLIDEYGGFSGIVTIEDLAEEIVGQIQDENDHAMPDFTKITDNIYRVVGNMPLEELYNELELEVPDTNCDTVSGFMIEQLGYIPSAQQLPVITHDTVRFVAEQMDGKHISIVRVEKTNTTPSDTE